MRIATPQIYQNATSQMLEQQANLNKTQVQLGSGKKIISPADDPAAAAEVLAKQKPISTKRGNIKRMQMRQYYA